MSFMKHITIAFFCLISINTTWANENKLSLTFGVYQSDKATIMYRKFLPIMEYLQENIEKQLSKSVDIELKIYKTYKQANDAVVNKQVDFVRFGPASYALAKEKNDNIQLIAMEHKKGKKIFKGLIIVSKASSLKTLADLKGKSFAFGNKNSTIGRYLAQAEMIKANIYAKDLAKFEYLGRHDKVYKAVSLGDFDAGAIKEGTFKRYNKNKEVKILHQFNNTTKPWLAREGLENTIVQSITNALVKLKNKSLLKELKASGFFKAKDDDYKFVREGMALSKQF